MAHLHLSLWFPRRKPILCKTSVGFPTIMEDKLNLQWRTRVVFDDATRVTAHTPIWAVHTVCKPKTRWWWEVNLALTQQVVVMATDAGKPSLLPQGAGTRQVHFGPLCASWKRCGREACWSDPARTRSHQAWQCSPPCWRGTRRQSNWTTDSQKNWVYNNTFNTCCIYEN